MPSLEKPCLLLPGGCERSPVYVCVPVDPTLAARSSVLETLMEYDGLVELPAGISFAEFEEWSTSDVEDTSALTLDELCAAIQVGEKLGAHNTAELTDAFAARVEGTCWSLADDHEAMLQAWLSLSKGAQQLVLRCVGRVPAKEAFSWPMAMQQALADQWVSHGHCDPQHRGFTVASGHTPSAVISFLSLLARTDPALPGLTSLYIDCAIPTAEAAARLSAALLHHPDLDRLSMRRLSCAPAVPAPPAATVLRTLPQLTAITFLTLSTPAPASSPPSAEDAEAAADVMHAMAAAVSGLPHLKRFHLHHTPSGSAHPAACRTGAPPPKRRRLAACMGPPVPATAQLSLTPVLAALSFAPALTDLTLPVITSCHAPSTLSTGACNWGHFSKLRSLQLNASHRTPARTACPTAQVIDAAATPCAPLLTGAGMPLPALKTIHLHCPDPLSGVDGRVIQQSIRSVHRHPVLNALSMHLGPKQTYHGMEALVLRVYTHVHEAPTNFSAVIKLNSRVPRAVEQVLLGGLSSLRSGRAAIDSCELFLNSGASDEALEAVGPTCEPLLRGLTTLTQLQSLNLHVTGVCPRDMVPRLRPFCTDLLSVPLRTFSALTSLHIHVPSECGIPLSAVAAHVAGVPRLQVLCIGSVVHGGVHEFEACFAPLTAVTHLEVGCRPVTADVVRAFARVVAGMPGLAFGSLKSCDGPETNPEATVDQFASVDWFQGLLDLPCRGRYNFYCRNDKSVEGEVDAVRQQLTARGTKVRDALDLVCFCSEAGSSTSADDPEEGR